MKTLTTVQVLVSAGIYLLLLPGCHKEKATDTNAVFTISLPYNSCSDIVVPGTYFTGTSIGNPDSTIVKVDVSEPGTWTVNSDAINGISFSGGGIFKDIGSHYIAIGWSGTPVSPGNSIHTFKTGNLQLNYFFCVLEKDIVLEPVLPDTPYFKVTFDNIEYNVTLTDDNPDIQSSGWSGVNDSLVFEGAVGPNTNLIPPGKGYLSVKKSYFRSNGTDAEFKDFFKPGNYPFAEKVCDFNSLGIIISWTRSIRDSWNSYYETDQEGSYFKIVGEEDGYNSLGQYYVKVKMKFSCKLFSYYPTEQVKQMSGEMVAYFIKYV